MNAHQVARGRGPRGLVAIALAIALAACSKSESPAPDRVAAPPASTPAPAAAPPPASTPNAAPETDGKLLERLARQEAATRLFDPRKPEPAPKPAPKPEPAAKTEPASKAAPTAKPAAAAPATAAAKPAVPPTPAPAAATTTTAPAKAATPGAPAKAAPPVPVPQPAAAKAAPPVPVPQPAAAKAAPPSAPAPSRLVSRVNPEFPREAAREGYDRGLVKVRMTLAADGSVTKVDVLESNPRRVFDREVTRALSQWKFSAGAAGRAVETEIEFTR